MTLVRVLRTAQVVVSHTFQVDETPTDATGSVTYTVNRLDGTVVASGTAGHPGPPGVYQATVPAQASVDVLTLSWTGTVGGAAVTATDTVEVVGGFLFGLAEARAMPPALDATRYPTATLARKRIAVEQEAEEICGQAFVPRFARAVVDGTGASSVRLPHVGVRALRAVSVSGSVVSLSGLYFTASGVLSGRSWTYGSRNVVVEYEHGWDQPPEDLKDAAMLRLRSRLSMGDSGVPQRALSFSVADGGVYRLSTPSAKRTGIPDVDGVYERYSIDPGGFA